MKWSIMKPAVNSTLQSGDGMRRQRRSQYVTPSPLILRLKESSDIPVWIAPGWKVMVLYFVTSSISKTLQNILMRIFRDP